MREITTETRRALRDLLPVLRVVCVSVVNALCVVLLVASSLAQNQQSPAPPKNVEAKPSPTPSVKSEPFDGAPVERMVGQCVTLETESGWIVIEMLPKAAPETVRSFLNLAATGALDTTTFSRVVRDFIVQGGSLSTSEKWGVELSQRAARRLPDEPNGIKHVRGVVSMARGDEPNTATTHFFILLGDAPHLDGKFAAFGRVTQGIEAVGAINHAPVEGEQPVVPVKIRRAVVAACKQ